MIIQHEDKLFEVLEGENDPNGNPVLVEKTETVGVNEGITIVPAEGLENG